MDYKVTGLTEITVSALAADDVMEIVDVSDTTLAATGTNKKVKFSSLSSRFVNNDAYGADVDLVSWVRRCRYDSVSGSDGDAISSCDDLGGSGDPLAQGTAGNRPTLKKGVNGINGHNVARFTSNDFLATTSGGASLTGDWYVWTVVKWSSLTGHQSFVSWGDGSGNGERRSLHKFLTTNLLYFIGEFADVESSQTLATGTVYLIEASYSTDTGKVTLWVNGTQVADAAPDPNALAAYSDADLVVGRNAGTGEYFEGDQAEVAWYAGTGTGSVQNAVRAYASSRYALTLPAVPATLAVGSDLAFGSGYHIYTGGTDLPFDDIPQVSVNGGFAAHAIGQGHQLSNSWADQNVLAIWSHTTDGFSAIAYLLPGDDGAEHGAVGVAVNRSPWGGADGSLYVECSNFTDPSKYGDFRIVQTKFTGGLHRLRSHLRDDTQDWEWYAGDGSTVVCRMLADGAFQSTAMRSTLTADVTNDSATLATTGLTVAVKAGRKYSFLAYLYVTTGAALEGVKAAMSGTSTVTNLVVDVEVKSHASTPVLTLGRATAYDSAVGQTVADAGNATVEISGTLTVNAAGTLRIDFAKNADTGAANTTVKRGSYLWVEDMP